MSINKHLVLVVGKSSSGKSASLRNLENQKGVIFLNCESGKELPFPNDFRSLTVTDPFQVLDAFRQAEEHKDVHTIVVDTITFMMDMYESTKVLTATNKMEAWGQYAQFFKTLMQDCVAKSTKNVIMLAHTMDVLNESEGIMETLVKVKGSLMNQGIEAYFSTVVSCKTVPLGKLSTYKNDNLIISEEDELVGFKYVYQTRKTKETVNDRIRAPMGLWGVNETFIDNDAQFLLNKLHEYYS